jgi:Fic family protein
MLDGNWEVINGPPAHHIQQLNAANTINVLEALVTLLISNNQPNQLPLAPSETAFRELHRCGTLFLLNKPGEYRDVPVQVANSQTGQVIYQAPPSDQVPSLMIEFFKELGEIWVNCDALDAAAFALWRINWVHPFKNGNGRTARAFCYACLNARLGVILPGTTTVIDQIMLTRSDYEAAIRTADQAAAADPKARSLKQMKDYLDGLLQSKLLAFLRNFKLRHPRCLGWEPATYLGTQNLPSPNPYNPVKLEIEIDLYRGLTFGPRPVCSRNLWEF